MDLIDENGFTTLSKAEHQAAGNKWYKENGNLNGFKKAYGIYNDPVKGPSFYSKNSNKKNPHNLSYRSYSSQNADKARRSKQESPEQVRHRFKTDAEFKQFKAWLRDGNKRNGLLASKASESGTKFEKGHVKALNAGGGHGPGDQRLETKLGNRSTTDRFEIPDDRLNKSGVATSWDDLVDKYQNPEKREFQLTPQDKQRIWNGEPPEQVKGQRQTAIDKNPLAKPNANRVGAQVPKAQRPSVLQQVGLNIKDFNLKGNGGRTLYAVIPFVGAGISLLNAGSSFAQGDVAGGLAHTAETVVGEIPIAGDAIVETVSGTSLGDGTVTGYEQERTNNPLHYGNHGPNVPRPGERERAKQLRQNPSSERGYETITNWVRDNVWNRFYQHPVPSI